MGSLEACRFDILVLLNSGPQYQQSYSCALPTCSTVKTADQDLVALILNPSGAVSRPIVPFLANPAFAYPDIVSEIMSSAAEGAGNTALQLYIGSGPQPVSVMSLCTA